MAMIFYVTKLEQSERDTNCSLNFSIHTILIPPKIALFVVRYHCVVCTRFLQGFDLIRRLLHDLGVGRIDCKVLCGHFDL